MRVLLAHAADAPARVLARQWGGSTVLLTPATLRRRDWRLTIDAQGTPVASLDGAPVGQAVTAVVTRLGGVAAAELPSVCREDQGYAAAELTAFLLAWLDACPCPVVNRPVAGSLNGPPWGPAQWAAAAGRAGLRVQRAHHRAVPGEPPVRPGSPGPSAGAAVTVVGGECLGPEGAEPVDATVARRVLELADAAGTSLLGVTLDRPGPGATVRGVTPWPDVGAAMVADALDAMLPAA